MATSGKTGAIVPARTGPIAAVARFSVRRHWEVLGGWIAALVILGILVGAVGGSYVDDITLPGAPSQRASDLLKAHFPAQAGDSATLVIRAPLSLGPTAIQDRITKLVTDAAKLPDVTGVIPPSPQLGSVKQVGSDVYAYATLRYGTQARLVPLSSVEKLEQYADSANTDGVNVEVGGPVVSASEGSKQDPAEAIGLVAAVIILLLAFGSYVAMGLPLLTALAGLGSGLLVLGLATRVINFGTITPAFVAMIGLGVGIDYALFIVTRHREGLADGLSVEEAAVTAVDTSGRAVMAAGTVVIIALLGLYAIGITFIGNLGAAAAIVVALSIGVALTLMPAFLGIFGHAIDRWRIARIYHSGSSEDATHGAGYRLSQMIQRRPWTSGAVALVILLVLAIPVLDIHLGFADDGTKPDSFHSRRAYDLLVAGFGPGVTAPLLVVADHTQAIDPQAVQKLAAALKTDGVESVTPPQISPDKTTAILGVIPTTGPSDAKTSALVHHLRDTVIPDAIQGTGMHAYVGGTTAAFVDVGDRTDARMPYFFLIVIGLSFLLLMAVFRSLTIPFTAAVMNLLSIGASYGVLVAVFQWGWGNQVLGIGRTGPIETYLPMILFAILFGLSTDYEVFLLSRIREHYLAGSSSGDAVAEGLATTTRIITAAAMIMVIVFLAFLTNESRVIKEFGFGMAVAVLVDATVVRMVLVPSTMELLGDKNWWFPAWLDRIVPKLNVEGEMEPVPAPAAGD